jgi:hypothetical protein
MAKTETFRIHQRPDGKFESCNGNPKDSPIGVDPSLNMAIGSARREPTLLSRDKGCTVVIKAMRKIGGQRLTGSRHRQTNEPSPMTDNTDLLDSRGHSPACTDFAVEPLADPNSTHIKVFCGCHDWPQPRILSNGTDVAWPESAAKAWRAKNVLARPSRPGSVP